MVDALTRVATALAAVGAALTFALWQDGRAGAQVCGAGGPFEFDTYEAENYVGVYGGAIELAAAGKAITFNYSVGGEPVDVRYQGLLRGPRAARTTTPDPSLAIPPSIFKSIAWIEASWANGASSVPYGGVGPVIRSFDCGYGLGQITTGMTNTTGTASARQAVIGTHFLFNLAEGARILADKWNSAPRYRPIAGQGDPAMLEDWYYAIWSYNGFAFVNHPLNPVRDPLRGEVYNCSDPSAPGYGTFVYGSYTYPEKVYGCMRYAPKKNGAPLWQAQAFNMPDLSVEQVAAAFDPKKFTACEDAGFAGGCPGMDFPTSLDLEGRQVRPNRDTTPPVDPGLAARYLGDPYFVYSGPTFMALTAYADGTATKGSVTVSNQGSFVGPFRIRTSAPWLVVRHPGQAGRNLDGSVAVGDETQVVTQSGSPGPPPRPRLFQQGYDSVLEVTLDPAVLPAGVSTGRVWIEPLLGGGGVFEVEVVAANGASAYPNKRVLPLLASGN